MLGLMRLVSNSVLAATLVGNSKKKNQQLSRYIHQETENQPKVAHTMDNIEQVQGSSPKPLTKMSENELPQGSVILPEKEITSIIPTTTVQNKTPRLAIRTAPPVKIKEPKQKACGIRTPHYKLRTKRAAGYDKNGHATSKPCMQRYKDLKGRTKYRKI